MWGGKGTYTFVNEKSDTEERKGKTPFFIAIRKTAFNPDDGKEYPLNGCVFDLKIAGNKEVYVDNGSPEDSYYEMRYVTATKRIATGYYYDFSDNTDMTLKTYNSRTYEMYGDGTGLLSNDFYNVITYSQGTDGTASTYTAKIPRMDGYTFVYLGTFDYTPAEILDDGSVRPASGSMPEIYIKESRDWTLKYGRNGDDIKPELVLGPDPETGLMSVRPVSPEDYEIDPASVTYELSSLASKVSGFGEHADREGLVAWATFKNSYTTRNGFVNLDIDYGSRPDSGYYYNRDNTIKVNEQEYKKDLLRLGVTVHGL